MTKIRKLIDIVEDAQNAPDFGQWFLGSKVIDDSGRPLLCYHGSFNEFDEFFTGSHFGDKDAANSRIDNRTQDRDTRFAGNHGVVYPVYLSIQNPLSVEDDHGLRDGYDLCNAAMKAGAITSEERSRCEDTGSSVIAKKRLFALLSDRGYDGMVYRNVVEGEGNSWITFSPRQIRFALPD